MPWSAWDDSQAVLRMYGQRKDDPKEIHYDSYSCRSVAHASRAMFSIDSDFSHGSGVEDGQTMRVNLGVSELFVTFRVKPSDKFRREKEDIHSEISVSIAQATLGGEVKVPGIYEDHVLQVEEILSRWSDVTKFPWNQIPAGTQSHQRFRLAGKGVKRLQGSGTGDHYVHVKIKIPTYVSHHLHQYFLHDPHSLFRKLTSEQKELILSLSKLDKEVEGSVNGSTQSKPGKQSLFDRSQWWTIYVLEAPAKEQEGFFKKLKKAIFDWRRSSLYAWMCRPICVCQITAPLFLLIFLSVRSLFSPRKTWSSALVLVLMF